MPRPEVETNDRVRRRLRWAYDAEVDARDSRAVPTWEAERRDSFVRLLLAEGKRSVLEVGGCTGRDSLLFRSHGLRVVCVDLSTAMARRCRAKGLFASVMDVARLGFAPESFDAVYARNCLIHVRRSELGMALAGIRRVLAPGGLCYIALYAGRDFEGILEDDSWEPKRFFSLHTDDQLKRLYAAHFRLRSFDRVDRG